MQTIILFRPNLIHFLSAAALLLVSGCGPERLGLGSPPTPTWVSVPTFTPSPTPAVEAALPTLEPVAPLAPAVVAPPIAEEVTPPAPAIEEGALTDELTETVEPVAADPLPTATPTPADSAAAPAAEPLLTVMMDAVNVRKGPGTDYEAIGVASRDDQYALMGRNAGGDWWQFCCVDGEPGWLYGELVTTQNADTVAVITDAPPPPAPAIAQQPAPQTPVENPAPEEQPSSIEQEAPLEDATAEEPAPQQPAPAQDSGTAGSFDPEAQYQIVHYRVLGFDDNNGGIFNKGGQQLIFLKVLDQNGAPLDGATVKDAVGDKLNVVTGSKGPGTAEIKMDWDPYKLYVAADPSGAATSQISNQMNNPFPHIPDVVGMLGPADNEYAICPTPDDRCTPPFYHAHWSYEITFQKVR